jgi:hypothetical protein
LKRKWSAAFTTLNLFEIVVTTRPPTLAAGPAKERNNTPNNETPNMNGRLSTKPPRIDPKCR